MEVDHLPLTVDLLPHLGRPSVLRNLPERAEVGLEVHEVGDERGVTDVSEFEVVRVDVRFMLPKRIREDLAAAAG